MKKGEVAFLTIAPEYAFGSSEAKQELAVVPSNSTVYYEVELVSFEKVSRFPLKVLLYHLSMFLWVDVRHVMLSLSGEGIMGYEYSGEN